MGKDTQGSKNPHQGHREKVKNRYYVDGIGGMPDHNVLELLLFFGIPYKDTNPIAHDLISHFGSFSGVLEAEVESLMKIKGMTNNAACLISLILPLYKRYMIDIQAKKPYLESKESIADYLRSLFLDTTDERVIALFFDNTRCLIGHSVIGQGDLVSCSADLRELANNVLSKKAASVIISHNHPHGIVVPSKDDIEATITVYKFLSMLKVQLLDHVIVNEDSFFSMSDNSKYAYIFCGLESSPREGSIDEKLAEATALYNRQEQEKRIAEARKRGDEIIRRRELEEQGNKSE